MIRQWGMVGYGRKIPVVDLSGMVDKAQTANVKTLTDY